MKHNFHIFRKNKHLKMQNDFIFVDTEAYEQKIDDETKNLYFRLGTVIIWNKKENKKNSFVFHDVKSFWREVENSFDDEHKTYIMYAHNMDYDFEQLNGFNELFKRNWSLINQYVRNRVFILVFKKDNYTLHIWDTTNYVSYGLDVIGETLGYPKLEIDFTTCTEKELEIYCMRDTEIVFVFIAKLIEFLEKNDLSRLRATASSLSFSIFRHKFYNIDEKMIWIHDFKRAIKLERLSYKGGITDVFKVGETDNIYKLDINSMYPDVMKKIKVPTKLIYYSHESDKKLIGFDVNDLELNDLNTKDYENISNKLMDIYNLFKKEYGVIAKCTVSIPKKYAYLLQDFGLGKTSFAYGTFKITLCTPELNFVEKYGKILKIHEINIYQVKNIFKDFVDFFYKLKRKYAKEGNEVYYEFTKIILNGQYGKWAQREFISERLNKKHKYLIKNQDLILEIIESKLHLIKKNAMVYLGSINSKELYVIDKELYISYNTKNNSKESFVAISSFIASQARMDLVRYILIAKRENDCYGDTDSLFVNETGYQNLLEANCIDDYELGKLKVEGYGKGIFYNPKFYDFYDIKMNERERKCKGINLKNKETKVLKENEFSVKYRVERWEKFKTRMKNDNRGNQLIHIITKTMTKKYDKGKVLDNNYVEPFHINEINSLNNF